MIVCVCHGVRCSEIRAAVRAGADTVEAIGLACDAGTDCGSCRCVVQDLLDEELETLAAGASNTGGRARGRVHLPMDRSAA